MLRAFCRRLIGRFEREFGYDAAYMRDLVDASPWTFLRFSMVTGLVRRQDAPGDLIAAAGIVATLAEDCGPCTQIGVDIASRGGVAPEVLRAVLAGDRTGMGEAAAIGYDFARAVLAKDMEAADPVRDEILRRWGKKGLVAVSLAITTGRMYPTLKYGLGHGQACSKVVVGGEAQGVTRPMALAA